MVGVLARAFSGVEAERKARSELVESMRRLPAVSGAKVYGLSEAFGHPAAASFNIKGHGL